MGVFDPAIFDSNIFDVDITAGPTGTLFEHYNEDSGNTFDYIYDVNWSGQTFTPSETHLLTGVRLKLYRVGTPGTVTVTMRATNNDDPPTPTGEDLASGTLNGDSLTTDTNGGWYWVPMGELLLNKGQHYTIVVKVPDAPPDESEYVAWLIKQYYGAYEGGTQVSTPDGGEWWSAIATQDCLFEEYGNIPLVSTGTSAPKHLTVPRRPQTLPGPSVQVIPQPAIEGMTFKELVEYVASLLTPGEDYVHLLSAAIWSASVKRRMKVDYEQELSDILMLAWMRLSKRERSDSLEGIRTALSWLPTPDSRDSFTQLESYVKALVGSLDRPSDRLQKALAPIASVHREPKTLPAALTLEALMLQEKMQESVNSMAPLLIELRKKLQKEKQN